MMFPGVTDVLLSKIDSLLTGVEGLTAENKNFEARIAQLEKSRLNSRPNRRAKRKVGQLKVVHKQSRRTQRTWMMHWNG